MRLYGDRRAEMDTQIGMPEAEYEDQDYLSKQLITYIGNKRSLLEFIGAGLDKVRKRLNKDRLEAFDVFSGSGVVSRYLKQFSDRLVVNDIEKYSYVINRCYLANRSDVDFQMLDYWYRYLRERLADGCLKPGMITELYAPRDIEHVCEHERCFYTPRNAMYIDTARSLLEMVPEGMRHFLLAPLLSEASIHANTAGVFKGFYKNASTGRGQYGGRNGDALFRILGNIQLEKPVFSRFDCQVEMHRADSNTIADVVEEVDVAYIDPPYNQHPYGSNYFMLNLIVDYVRPQNISKVSGIPKGWYRSDYNKRRNAYQSLSDLVHKINAKYLLISFNSEGFISVEEMLELLRGVGRTQMLETRYNAFRGSRNLSNRDIHVKEYLYLVEKR